MKKFPFTKVGIYSAIMTVLILLRGIVSVGRHYYYGGRSYLSVLINDRWMYVGIATAALTIVCFILAWLRRQNDDDEPDTDITL